MTARVYRWDDVDAPVLTSPTAGVIAVLDGCLVNGYTGKPAAGWTKEFSGTNLAAYRQGGGSMCYLRIDNSVTNAGLCRVVGYESMTGINTGTNAFPTETQFPGGLYINTSTSSTASNRPWILIADDRRFYLWTGYVSPLTTDSALSASTTYQGLFFFGDITSYKAGDAYSCQIIAATATGGTSERFANIDAINAVIVGHYIVRNAAHAVGAIQNSKWGDSSGSTGVAIGSSSGVPYPSGVSGGINLARISVGNGSATVGLRGRLPGAWAPLHSLPGANGDTFSGTGELTGRAFILLDIGSGSTRGRIALETSDTWD